MCAVRAVRRVPRCGWHPHRGPVLRRLRRGDTLTDQGVAPSSARNPTRLMFVATDAERWCRDGSVGVVLAASYRTAPRCQCSPCSCPVPCRTGRSRPGSWTRRQGSVVRVRLPSAALADAVAAVDGRDVEPGHRGVAVPYFTETGRAKRDAVRCGARASRDVYSAEERWPRHGGCGEGTMGTMSAEASASTAVWRRSFFSARVIAAVADVGGGSKRVACWSRQGR